MATSNFKVENVDDVDIEEVKRGHPGVNNPDTPAGRLSLSLQSRASYYVISIDNPL